MSYLREVVSDLKVLAERVKNVNKSIENENTMLKSYQIKYMTYTKVIMEFFEKDKYSDINSLYFHMCQMKDLIDRSMIKINEYLSMRIEVANMNMFNGVVAQMRGGCDCKICQKATIKLNLEKVMKINEIEFNPKIDIIAKIVPLFVMVAKLEQDKTSQEMSKGFRKIMMGLKPIFVKKDIKLITDAIKIDELWTTLNTEYDKLKNFILNEDEDGDAGLYLDFDCPNGKNLIADAMRKFIADAMRKFDITKAKPKEEDPIVAQLVVDNAW
jgi:hypothetical protein